MKDIPAAGRPTRETSIGIGILLILAAIATTVFLKQFHYNRAVLVGSGTEGVDFAEPTAILSRDFIADLAQGMVPLTPPETFGPENLSDKIDGKAELYLSAGFLSLLCQRLAEKGDSPSWMEAFVYDMGTIRRAFAVYSTQRRPDAANVELTEFAYRTENALFFVHGRYYVEVIAAVTTEKMAEAMRSFAHNFIRKTAVQGKGIDELSLFPREGLDEDSIRLLISDAFGFDRLDNVFTASYNMGDAELMAFLSLRKDPSEASQLVAAYRAFLIANGGVEVKSPMEIPGAQMVRILDTFELMLSHGTFIAGVHGAENKGRAEKLATALMRRLSEAET